MIDYIYPKYYLDMAESETEAGDVSMDLYEATPSVSTTPNLSTTPTGLITPTVIVSNNPVVPKDFIPIEITTSGGLTYPSAQIDNVSSDDGVSDIGNFVSTLHHGAIQRGASADIFTIVFDANEGYFYSKEPVPNLEFEEQNDYTIVNTSEVFDDIGRIVKKSFTIRYTDNGTIPKVNDHSIFFTHETSPIMLPPKEAKEITSMKIDLKDIPQSGIVKPISIFGAAGTPFAISINDMYGNNILAPTKRYNRVLQVAVNSSRILNLNTTDYLQVGMQLSGSGIGHGITISSIKDNKNIVISKPQTISADAVISFNSGSLLDDATIPNSGVYSFNQAFPALTTYTKTLKEAASSTTTLVLDSVVDLEVGMRVTGSGVDGQHVTIKSIDTTQSDSAQITVSETQTISDETTLTFTTSYNVYNIHVKPRKGSVLGGSIPLDIPTYQIKQYIDPVITFTPTTALANSSVTGTISLTKPTGYTSVPSVEINTRPTEVNLSIVATSTSGAFTIDRQPRFSNSNSTLSDFTNTSSVTKQVAVYSGHETPFIVLNNATDLTVGMRVTGHNIVQPVIPVDDCNPESQSPANPDYKEVTIKSITDNVIELSHSQTIPCEDVLKFDNGGTFISISDLSAVLSENTPLEGSAVANGKCTITGTGIVQKFGKDSITCTINIDNFLSKA